MAAGQSDEKVRQAEEGGTRSWALAVWLASKAPQAREAAGGPWCGNPELTSALADVEAPGGAALCCGHPRGARARRARHRPCRPIGFGCGVSGGHSAHASLVPLHQAWGRRPACGPVPTAPLALTVTLMACVRCKGRCKCGGVGEQVSGYNVSRSNLAQPHVPTPHAKSDGVA